MEHLYVYCIACGGMFKIWDYVSDFGTPPLYSCPHCDHIGRVEISSIPKIKYIGFILNRAL